MPAKPFLFICGPDDFLVNRLGQERYATLAAGVTDEFSREVINGFANNVGEVEAAVNRLREAVQTLSLFGGRRVVWLKDVNFLADTVTGRAEGTLRQVEELQALLGGVNPDEVAVVVTAAPVDRRRSFIKWCEAAADYALVGEEGKDGGAALAQVALAEAAAQGVTVEPEGLSLLLAKVGTNPRLLVEEVRKLASYAGEGGVIEEKHVEELTPNFAEGDFFETVEAFGRGDLPWTLAALHRHFFTGGDARPVAVLQGDEDRPGVAAGEEMPVQCGQRPRQVAAAKRLHRLEKVPLREIGRQFLDVFFFNDATLARVARELAHFLHQQPRVVSHLGQQQAEPLRLTVTPCAAASASATCASAHEPIQLLHEPAVFPVVVRHAQRRFELRPDGKRFVQLCG